MKSKKWERRRRVKTWLRERKTRFGYADIDLRACRRMKRAPRLHRVLRWVTSDAYRCGSRSPGRWWAAGWGLASVPLYKRIACEALDYVDHPDRPSPATDGGRLGCAEVVSRILRRADVPVPHCLAVRELMAKLVDLGWTEIAPPGRSGDVLIRFDPTMAGVLAFVDVVANSSVTGRPCRRLLPPGNEGWIVLRAPEGRRP